MSGKAYEPDLIFSWPNAKIGVMGGEQAAKTMEQVMIASAERKGNTEDNEKLKSQLVEITEKYNSQSDAFTTSGRGLDYGLINPVDTRKILGECLNIISDGDKRELKPNTFGVARM